MSRNSNRFGRIVSVAVSVAMAFTLTLAPGVASAYAAEDLAVTSAGASGIPEWAIDDGQDARIGGLSTQVGLPAAYDLRSEDLVTPVKFQNPWGSCWAFGGIAAAEISILSAYNSTYSESKLDLSEKHLTYMAMQPVSDAVDPDQAGEGLRPFDKSPNAVLNAGGMPVLITTVFSQGIGPVEESLYPYWGKEKITSLDYLNAHTDEVVAKELREYAEYYGMTEEEFLQDFWTRRGEGTYSEKAVMELFADFLKENYANGLTYSENDDWSIPEINADGSSNRLVSNGFVLKNGNILPTYWENAQTDEAPTREGMNAIKQELVNGRGVSIMYGADQSGAYTNSSNEGGEMFCQYTDVAGQVNHGVCIVGWDDSYSKANFKEGVQPPADGAWIVKNSWGSTADAAKDANGNVVNRREYGAKNAHGEYTGYFYLSYYDRTIKSAESMEFTSNLGTSGAFATLQHDYMPGTDTLKTPTMASVVSSANVFDAEVDMVLKSVSTRTSETNMRVTFAVYRLNDNAKSPDDGELLMRTSCNFEYGGFHRLDLDQPITFKAGEKFSIVSTTSLLGDDGKRVYSAAANTGMTKEAAEALANMGAKIKSYCTATVNPGESWLFAEGKWEDWSNSIAALPEAVRQQYAIDNFSIKAYVEPAESTLVHFDGAAASYTAPGNIEYWYDTDSGKYYADEGKTKEITRDATVIAALAGAKTGTIVTAGTGATKAQYVITGKNTVTYKAVASKNTTKATVPTKVVINGKVYKVTKIASKAFSGSKATSITVGSYVTAIYKNTFAGAKKVKTITLGKKVKKVSAKAFTTNKALRTISVKTKKLAKKANIKNCLKGSKVTTLKVSLGTTATNKTYIKKYKKLFAVSKPASGKKVTVK